MEPETASVSIELKAVLIAFAGIVFSVLSFLVVFLFNLVKTTLVELQANSNQEKVNMVYVKTQLENLVKIHDLASKKFEIYDKMFHNTNISLTRIEQDLRNVKENLKKNPEQ